MSSKYLSAQKELKALTLMLTSDEAKEVIRSISLTFKALLQIKRDYEKEFFNLNDVINKQAFEISELRYEVDYFEKRLYDKITVNFYEQEFGRTLDSAKKDGASSGIAYNHNFESFRSACRR